MSEEFGGFDLALGKAVGLRRWKLTTDGYLESPMRTYYWEGGENEADCAGIRAFGMSLPWHTFNHCSCGFYALSSKAHLDQYPGPIVGVLEGWGKVVIGAKGWRAEKGAVKAIVLPPAKPGRRLRGFLLDGWNKIVIPLAVLYSLLCLALAGYLYAFQGDFVGWVSVTVCGVLGQLMIRSRWDRYSVAWKGRERDAQLHELVRLRYPGIEIYPSVGALLAAYKGKLTQPVPEEIPTAEQLV